MTGPRTKRQFAGAASDPSQRSITSFFSRSTSGANSNSANPSPKPPLDGPAVPAQIQTDLLNVGMRVRKAIPEGYKTGTAYSAFTLWAEDNATKNTADDAQPSSAPSSVPYNSSMRELEPFCGLNRVGGLAFQPAYDSSSNGDGNPGLTSSQDTVSSSSSFSPSSFAAFANPAGTLNIATAFSSAPQPPTRKRIYTTDEEEAAHSALSTTLPYRGPTRLSSDNPVAAWLEEEVSPRSLVPPAGAWENARVLAVPRRSEEEDDDDDEEMGGSGQENVMVVGKGRDGNDFEEANFLDYGRMEVE
ncbi:uncharacterized protein C8A04DRAFT_16141 [Dichotomopilus funicola]|uniref:Uncharacterized protein n=1 Tax=Dichotomopilus funicola TaxID=1934379 RepID=A0AAN6ZIS6_9PEZI|nr:hypothetical protein C8A04DRAFT_16141 [Dichotomopilus funicola]